MCGRFGLFARLDAIQDYFGVEVNYDHEPRYNIAPRTDTAVVQNETPDEINELNWGIRPHWVDDPDDWHHPINARAESVDEKPSFREAFKKRRCLIPASNFYEWTGPKGSRRPFFIGVEDRELFAMAGLWETWSENGTEFQSFTIITTDANEVVGELHNRMPLILKSDEEQRWLEEDDPDELQSMLDPFPDEQTRSYEVSTKVNSTANDGPELIEPLEGEQSGLGDF